MPYQPGKSAIGMVSENMTILEGSLNDLQLGDQLGSRIGSPDFPNFFKIHFFKETSPLTKHHKANGMKHTWNDAKHTPNPIR